MRMRVAAVVFLLAGLIIAALVSSYLLERVETPRAVPEPPVALVTPAPPPRIEAPQRTAATPDAAVAMISDAGRTPAKEFPSADPVNVPFYVGPGQASLQSACQDAVERCALKFPPWFASTLTTELELERRGAGSRIARAHPQKNGPPAFLQCVAETLTDADLPSVPLENDQLMVRCAPRTSKTKTLFPSSAKFRDELERCLPKFPEGEATVKFSIVNDDGVIKTSAFTFSGLDDLDAYARKCLELGLETRVVASPGELPDALPNVTLSVSDGGKKTSNSFSFRPR